MHASILNAAPVSMMRLIVLSLALLSIFIFFLQDIQISLTSSLWLLQMLGNALLFDFVQILNLLDFLPLLPLLQFFLIQIDKFLQSLLMLIVDLGQFTLFLI